MSYRQLGQKSTLKQDILTIRGLLYTILGAGLLSLLFHQPSKFVQREDQSNINFNRLKTAECSTPVAERPHIQYSIVLDAGSTGSRIHVYRFNYCKGKQPTLEDEVFIQKKPGLSSFSKDPEKAADSLVELMNIAVDNVPVALHKCTPLTLKATAGLRMLPNGQGDLILQKVTAFLRTFPFPINDEDGVAIMGGDQEGVYAWITVNYLLGTITSSNKESTAGILDLGGGSTQIVFEPSSASLPPGKHLYALDFGGKKYNLYQHSYDGYGLMQGRLKVAKASHKDQNAPCVPRDRVVKIKEGETNEIKISGTGNGFQQCESFIRSNLFDKSQVCSLEPCSFEGVYMPSIAENDMLYAFSYFYDNFAKLFDKVEHFVVEDIKKAAEKICSSDAAKLENQVLAELEKNHAWCIDLGFMYSLLHTGYNLDDKRQLRTAKKINSIEIGWSLGAAIQLLDTQMKDPSKRMCGT